MKPSQDTIAEFRSLYAEEFGERLAHQEAYDRFLRLVNVVRVVYGYKAKHEETESGFHGQPVDQRLGHGRLRDYQA